jgi:hypothetical protein
MIMPTIYVPDEQVYIKLLESLSYCNYFIAITHNTVTVTAGTFEP